MRLIDRFSVLLLDMNNTFMFSEDRFGPDQDFYATYRGLGGSRLSSEEVTAAIRACYDGMALAYKSPEHFDNFPSLAEGFLQYANVEEADLIQLEAVFAAHELGSIPTAYAAVLQRLSQTHQLGLVSNIWARKGPWLRELTRVGVLDLFQTTIFSSDSRSIKPSLVLFRQALQAFPDNARVLFIGDSLRCDIVPAKELGLATAWINPDRTKAPLADFVMADLQEIDSLKV